MKIFKLDLLTLLISLFILGACNNPEEIGLDLDPNNSINSAINETSTVKAFTVPEDKIVTNNLEKYPLGYFVDPQMGITTAAVGATLNLPSDALTFGTNIVLDSAVLVLRYAGEFYGDSTTSSYKFTVNQLSDKLSTESHYSNTPIGFNNTEIGSLTVSKIKLNDSVKVKQIVKGATDTQLKQAPQIRIPINSTFINDNFLNATADKFTNSTAFINHIKGLYLQVAPMNGAQAGGVPFFDLASGASKLELYYRNVNATIDTNYLTFAISNTSSPVVAHIVHDYTGKEVATQLANPGVEYDRTYTQALSGVRTKVTFPDLDQLKQLGQIVINKAELVVSVDGGSDVPFAPAPRLGLYQTDIASQRQLVQDINPYDSRSVGLFGFGGTYNATAKTYTFTLTSYIQDLLLGQTKQYALYLAPVPLYMNALGTLSAASGIVAGKAVLGSGKSANFKMKLRVKYTLINN